MEKRFFLLIVAASMMQGTWSLHWAPGVLDINTVHACLGGNLTLPWRVSLDAGETVKDVHWFYAGSGSVELIATTSLGNFYPMPAFSGRVHMSGEAGLVLEGVVSSDAGNYSVEVLVGKAGGVDVLRHSVLVDVATESPAAEGGSLRVQQERGTVVDPGTSEHHVALTCGKLTNQGQPPVELQWTTPNGSIVPGTFQTNGVSTLLLPNPVQGGTYTCHIPPKDSQATSCLPSLSPLLRNQTVAVDEIGARLTLLESDLRATNQRLVKETVDLRNETVELKQQVAVLRGDNVRLNNTVERLEEKSSKHVSFHVGISTIKPHSDPFVFDIVYSNQGSAYNPSTGQFTAPYNGTYFFAASVSPYSSYSVNAFITVNGTYISRCYTDEDYRNMASCQAITQLQKDQQVWLSASGSSNLYSGSTYFSGFLINVD